LKKKKSHWIQGAIKHPGALTRAAKAAGKSVAAYCASPNLSPTAARRCALRKTLKGMHHG